jgi:hypothetical protein
LDDISPLRQFSDDVQKKAVHLYTPGPAYRIQAGQAGEHHPSKRTGQNPPTGAAIYFYLAEEPKAGTEVKLEILDASGKTIRKYSSTETKSLDEPPDPDDKKPEKEIKPEAGLNRFVWDLHYEEAHHVPGYYLWEYNGGAKGPVAAPGQYQVRLTMGEEIQVAPLEVQLDPRVKVSQEDLARQFAMQMQLHDELNSVYDAVNQIQDVRSQVAGLKRRLPQNASAKTIIVSADDLEKKLVAVRNPLVNLTISANEDSLAYPPELDARLAYLAMDLGTADSAPTQAEQLEFEKLNVQVKELLGHWEQLQSHDLASFRKLTAESSLSTVEVPPAGRGGESDNTESH